MIIGSQSISILIKPAAATVPQLNVGNYDFFLVGRQKVSIRTVDFNFRETTISMNVNTKKTLLHISWSIYINSSQRYWAEKIIWKCDFFLNKKNNNFLCIFILSQKKILCNICSFWLFGPDDVFFVVVVVRCTVLFSTFSFWSAIYVMIWNLDVLFSTCQYPKQFGK